MPHIHDVELPEDAWWKVFELAAREQRKAHEQASLLILRQLECERRREEAQPAAGSSAEIA